MKPTDFTSVAIGIAVGFALTTIIGKSGNCGCDGGTTLGYIDQPLEADLSGGHPCIDCYREFDGTITCVRKKTKMCNNVGGLWNHPYAS